MPFFTFSWFSVTVSLVIGFQAGTCPKKREVRRKREVWVLGVVLLNQALCEAQPPKEAKQRAFVIFDTR